MVCDVSLFIRRKYVLTELKIEKLNSSVEKPSGKYHRTHNVQILFHDLYCFFFFPLTGELGGTAGRVRKTWGT